MKYAHYDDTTWRLLGWYDDTIHDVIPEPIIQVSEEQWQEAISNNYNYVDVVNGSIGYKDFRTLDEIKQAKKQEIESAYSQAIQVPIQIDVGGSTYTFQADQKSQDILTKVITSAPDGFETEWLDIKNHHVRMTLQDLKNLAQAILIRGQELFRKKVQLKQQIDQAQTKEDVEAIKWE